MDDCACLYEGIGWHYAETAYGRYGSKEYLKDFEIQAGEELAGGIEGIEGIEGFGGFEGFEGIDTSIR